MTLTVSFQTGSSCTSDFDLLVRQSFEGKVSIPTNNDPRLVEAIADRFERIAYLLKANTSQVAAAIEQFGSNPAEGRAELDNLGLNEKSLSPDGTSAAALVAVALALITVPGTPG